MGASILAPRSAGRTLTIRGTAYPVLLPKIRDPRLRVAAVITSLQVIGQTAFGFQLSIAQILVSLLTCAVLEIGITFRRRRVIMWPASALLTGNGIAFVLRVPGTEHGDWWSMNGWWIFAATAAVALLSKHLIRFRGHHFLNPSNFGLVVFFVLLGSTRADPLALWWGPMSAWMVLALGIIVVGVFTILLRLHLLEIAVTFWVTFALGIGVIAAAGHEMTARWHLDPITGVDFWRVLVFSPEVLIFLFFMITDPKTSPSGKRHRRVYAVSIGLLAVLLIAPTTTEFWTKVALLGALTFVCAARPVIALLTPRFGPRFVAPRRPVLVALTVGGATAFSAALVLAGLPARPSAAFASPASTTNKGAEALPPTTVLPSKGVATHLDAARARRITGDLVADFGIEAVALRTRDKSRAASAAGGTRLQVLWKQIGLTSNRALIVPERHVTSVQLNLEAAVDQAPPLVIATVSGTERLLTVEGTPPAVAFRGNETPFTRTLELQLDRGRYVIVGMRSGTPEAAAAGASTELASSGFGGIRLDDVAMQVGLDFRQSAFRTPRTTDPIAMMGGGVCWVDTDNDGWLDLFAVNSYSDLDYGYWLEHGGVPRSALFLNRKGTFTDVSRTSGAGIRIRGNGCVAGDFNGDGFSDIYVTAAGNDALLWNDGAGHFAEGARAAGITAWGWHSGAAIGDVNGDGRPDLFVAGYTDPNARILDSTSGFPNDHLGVRDLLYLNAGNDRKGRARFREVGKRAGIDRRVEHGLGAVFTDVNNDGRLDLYVANDANPNRLYLNLVSGRAARGGSGGLDFKLEERAGRSGIADPNAGMGIAAADYSGDGSTDLLVTNSHKQLHAVFRSDGVAGKAPAFSDARSDIAGAFDTRLAGWGVSWVDLDLDGNLDLVVANGSIPVVGPKQSAEPVQAFENLTGHGHSGQFADASRAVGLANAPRVIGRGLAAADFDNDGSVDIAVNSIGGKLMLLANTGARGNWLIVKPGAFAPGTIVTAVLPNGRRLVQELKAGSSYLSSEDPRAHFGLGRVKTVSELIVRSPDGRVRRLTDVGANQILNLAR